MPNTSALRGIGIGIGVDADLLCTADAKSGAILGAAVTGGNDLASDETALSFESESEFEFESDTESDTECGPNTEVVCIA